MRKKDDRAFWKWFGIVSAILAVMFLVYGIYNLTGKMAGTGLVPAFVFAVFASGSILVYKQKTMPMLELASAPVSSKQPCPFNACPFLGAIDPAERMICNYECPPMA